MASFISTNFGSSSCSACLIRSDKQQLGFVTLKPGSSCGKKLITRRQLQMCHAVQAEPSTLETVQKVIASQLSVDQVDVKPESKFADLGADSLDTVEIMMNLEESFKISLGEEGAEKIATVQDAADLIQGVISK